MNAEAHRIRRLPRKASPSRRTLPLSQTVRSESPSREVLNPPPDAVGRVGRFEVVPRSAVALVLISGALAAALIQPRFLLAQGAAGDPLPRLGDPPASRERREELEDPFGPPPPPLRPDRPAGERPPSDRPRNDALPTDRPRVDPRGEPRDADPLRNPDGSALQPGEPGLSNDPRRPEPRRQLDGRDEPSVIPADVPATTDGGMTINPVLLQTVQDRTLGLQAGDRAAYFYMLWLCRQLPAGDLSKFALSFRAERQRWLEHQARKPLPPLKPFADVFKHPEEYRGRPVTLRGYFRKLAKFDPGKNDLGFRHAYEGWLYTADSDSNPAVVVFSSKPDGLTIGNDITEEVEFAGYFLKMYGYQAQDTTRQAPMFIAGEVTWYPSRPANQTWQVPGWLYVTVAVATLFAILGVIRMNSERRFRRGQPSALQTPGRNFDEYPPQEFLTPDEIDNPPPRTDHQH